jgi:hypothetical protein
VLWLTQFQHGMVTTVVCPTQPYLVRSVHPSSLCSGSPSSGMGWWPPWWVQPSHTWPGQSIYLHRGGPTPAIPGQVSPSLFIVVVSHPAIPGQVSSSLFSVVVSHPAIPGQVSPIPLHLGGSHPAISGQDSPSLFTVVGPTQPYLARSVNSSSPCPGSLSWGTGW